MNKKEYKEKRTALMASAKALIDEDKIEEFNKVKAQVEALDADFEAAATAQANFNAMQEDRERMRYGMHSDFIAAQLGGARVSFGSEVTYEKGKNNMTFKNETQVKAFQDFMARGGDMRTMNPELRNAVITTTGGGAVLPIDIYRQLITDEKFSDLLHLATVLNQSGAGTVKIPVASAAEASWKTEGAAATATDPTLTSIDLGGKELMRVIQYSAAMDSMAIDEFSEMMSQLVSSEVIETLEKAFISGSTTNGQPHAGLENLTWTAGTNMIQTASTTTEIAAADVAKGLSLLPQKYARNAVLLMNANTAYNVISLFKGTNEYAYNVADGAASFMGKPVTVNEHCADGEIFIVDPAQLYVRFALPMSVVIDNSTGFMSATTAMRCLTVVDYAWNTAACVKVAKKTA